MTLSEVILVPEHQDVSANVKILLHFIRNSPVLFLTILLSATHF